MPSGPRLDLCEITDGSTISTFNPTTGELELSTLDTVGVPVGTYVFDIMVEVGDKTFTTKYTVEFQNPCTVLPIEIVQPMHFNDHTHYLRDLKYSQDWTVSDLATSPTDVSCGDMVVSF
jgi:hypothetical protein